MRKLEILASKGGCSEETLKNLERSLGTHLPGDYREFLLNHDGGLAGPGNRFIRREAHKHLSNSLLVDRFLSVTKIIRAREEWADLLPSAYLVIAENVFGDLVCLDLSPGTHPIISWEHDHEHLDFEGDDIPALEHNAFIKVANSFEEFADMLGEIPEPGKPR